MLANYSKHAETQWVSKQKCTMRESARSFFSRAHTQKKSCLRLDFSNSTWFLWIALPVKTV